MLLHPSKFLFQSQKALSRSTFLPSTSYSFTTWKPNVPNFQIRSDSSKYHMVHPIWDLKAAEQIKETHYEPKNLKDRAALILARTIKGSFDLLSGFKPGKTNEAEYARRIFMLETISAVPGLFGGMFRHMKSIRRLVPDSGWIHHLLEEAENQRVHLLIFIDLRKPGAAFRYAVLAGQFFFIILYSMLYFVSPRTAHRYTGYLGENAVKIYTHCINDLDAGKLPKWENLAAPELAVEYWDLPKDAKLRDVLLAIRADEVMHREMNHHFAEMKPKEHIEKLDRIIAKNQQ